jgi:DNA-3-methyladenine glycosylase II
MLQGDYTISKMLETIIYTRDMSFEDELNLAAAHLAKNDPHMGSIIKNAGICTIRPHRNYYSELFDSIVSQQLSVKAAAAIMKRIQEHYGSAHPEPEKVVGTEVETFRGLGLSRAKAAYVRDLAEHVLDGRLDLAHISTLDDQTVIDQLTAVKGIGEWTAHMFMMFSLGRLNILAWGDLGIKKAVQIVYGLDSLPAKEDMVAISAQNKWAPYQTVACWYLWKVLDNEPALGT